LSEHGGEGDRVRDVFEEASLGERLLDDHAGRT
jgi:hypothetical protein